VSAASADFLNQLEVADCGCRATALGKRINFSLFHIDQAELAATAGAIDTLKVRVIDQLDTVLAVGTADLHGDGNPGDVTGSLCHAMAGGYQRRDRGPWVRTLVSWRDFVSESSDSDFRRLFRQRLKHL
jgi:hypothetical protein